MQLQNLESKQTELDSQSKLLQATEEGLNLTVEKLTEAKTSCWKPRRECRNWRRELPRSRARSRSWRSS
ncbi:MAG: hypothetical protein ACLRMZ_17560 [Blautia marasmi]